MADLGDSWGCILLAIWPQRLPCSNNDLCFRNDGFMETGTHLLTCYSEVMPIDLVRACLRDLLFRQLRVRGWRTVTSWNWNVLCCDITHDTLQTFDPAHCCSRSSQLAYFIRSFVLI